MGSLPLVTEMLGKINSTIAQLRTMIGEVMAVMTKISDSARPHDELNITVQAAPKVYCVHCRLHIYYLKNENGSVSVANLAPLPGGPTPINFDCPHCGQDFRAYAPEPTLKTDKGYWKKRADRRDDRTALQSTVAMTEGE